MSKDYGRGRHEANGFSNPNQSKLVADVSGRPLHDRRMQAAGFPIDDAAEENRRNLLNRLRHGLEPIVGHGPSFALLLQVVEKTISFRKLADDTTVTVSTLTRRFPKYLAKLKAAILSNPELRALVEEFLGDLDE